MFGNQKKGGSRMKTVHFAAIHKNQKKKKKT